MAAKKKADPVNPLSGTSEPNTYSKGDASLWSEVNPQPEKTDPYIEHTNRRAARRSKEFQESRAGRKFQHPAYGEVDIDSAGWSAKDMGGVAGYQLGGRGFNEPPETVSQGPAINEPHQVDPNLPHFRRAEDLSGKEYQKGLDVLKARGATPEVMAKNVTDAYEVSEAKALAAHASRPAGTGFYQDPHTPNPTKPEELLRNLSTDISRSSAFNDSADAARAVAAAATADTSPNAKVVLHYKDANKPPTYPNHGGARAAVEHVLAGGDPSQAPKAAGVYHGNIKKAAEKVQAAVEGQGVGSMYKPNKAPKTAAFYGAQYKPSTPDSMTVVDVHALHVAAPHLDTRESAVFDVVGPDGQLHHPLTKDGTRSKNSMGHTFEAEDLGADGLPKPHLAKKRLEHHIGQGASGAGYRYVRRMTEVNGKQVPASGDSPAEALLSKAGYPGYAMIDRAHREGAANVGLVPSPDHAQASNHMQEVGWQKERHDRSDIPVNMDTDFEGWRDATGSHDDFDVTNSSTWRPEVIARGGRK